MRGLSIWALPLGVVLVAATVVTAVVFNLASAEPRPTQEVTTAELEPQSRALPESPVVTPPVPRIETPPAGTPAPDFVGIDHWLNSAALSLEELRGKVVLIDFWTYSCINCQRTLPYVRSWHDKYADRGLVVVGVHSPEFDFERDLDNVEEAMSRLGVNWAVATDNGFKTWRAYDNRWWPHKFLIDRDGQIRYHHIGEGAYQETELHIRNLLQEAGAPVSDLPLTGLLAQ